MSARRRIISLWAVLAATFTVLAAQEPNLDPRAMGMAGATTSNAQGIHAVGFNPALLAFSRKDFSINLGGLAFGVLNNFLSIAQYNEINGTDLRDPTSPDYVDKEQFLASIPDRGMQIISLMHIPTPGFNWARGTQAFSSDVIIYGDMSLPKALFEVIFRGNPVGQELNLKLEEEVIGVVEWGFSIAAPQGNVALGATIKYLQGLFYLGVDQDSSSGFFRTDSAGFLGQGRYLVRQAVGGSGLALDIGFATAEVDGYSFGISLINAFGRIKWHGPSVTKDLFGEALQGMMPWGENEYFLYTFEIGDVDANKGITGLDLLGGESQDSLFVKESYTVFLHPDSGIVRSEGRKPSDFEPAPFVTNYPTTLRIGGSKRVENVGLFTIDLTTGFENRLWSSRGWQLGVAMELQPTPMIPIRLGYRYAGEQKQQLGMGFGIYAGPLQFDFGLSFHNGVWLQNVKGLSLAFSFTLVR